MLSAGLFRHRGRKGVPLKVRRMAAARLAGQVAGAAGDC